MSNTTDVAKEIIAYHYNQELEGEPVEPMDVNFTVKAGADDVAMLNAIAARFGTDRIKLIYPAIHKITVEMFMALNEKDRDAVAATADRETVEMLRKRGFNPVQFENTDEIMAHNFGRDLPDEEVQRWLKAVYGFNMNTWVQASEFAKKGSKK